MEVPLMSGWNRGKATWVYVADASKGKREGEHIKQPSSIDPLWILLTSYTVLNEDIHKATQPIPMNIKSKIGIQHISKILTKLSSNFPKTKDQYHWTRGKQINFPTLMGPDTHQADGLRWMLH